MKIKNKLRHFWRNNRKCIGMYSAGVMLLCAIISAVIGDIDTLFWTTVMAEMCGLVWLLERTVLSLVRLQELRDHRRKKELLLYYKLGQEDGKEIAKRELVHKPGDDCITSAELDHQYYGAVFGKNETIKAACKWLDDHFDDEMYNKSFVEWLPMFRQALEEA